MTLSRKQKVSMAVAVIAAVGSIGAAATTELLSNTGNNNNITQIGNNNNACANGSKCIQHK